jgi:hypothetical protein
VVVGLVLVDPPVAQGLMLLRKQGIALPAEGP